MSKSHGTNKNRNFLSKFPTIKNLFKRSGQNTVEVLLVLGAVTAVAIIALAPTGVVTQGIDDSLDKVFDGVERMADDICYDANQQAWVVGRWSECSTECGAGEQTRTVECPSGCCAGVPPPTSRPCDNDPCPIDGEWCPWSDCQGNCGNEGTQSRVCNCPAPAFGGEDCEGDSQQDCQMPGCPESCGDGFQDPDEECDDGNNTNCDGCSSVCRDEFCGNDIVEELCGEQCDGGNDLPCDGCNETCQLEICGNGVMDCFEECDGDDFGGLTCETMPDTDFSFGRFFIF